MPGANNNGEFFDCIQELEDALPDDARRPFRKAAVHWLRMEERMRDQENAHTDPETGKPYDVRNAYSTLADSQRQLSKLTRAYWWASGVGTMMTVVVGLSGYIVKTTLGHLENTLRGHEIALKEVSLVNQEQTIVLTRLQAVQISVVDEFRALRNHRNAP